MKFTYHFVLVVFCASVTSKSVYSDLKENLLTYLRSVHKAYPLPEQGDQVDETQPSLDGTGEKVQNPTYLEFIRVEPKKDPVRDDVQPLTDTDVQKSEDGKAAVGSQLQPKPDVGTDTYAHKEDDTEKVTEYLEQWATSHSPRVKAHLDLEKPVKEPVFGQSDARIDPEDAQVAKIKSNILRTAKEHEDQLNTNIDLPKIEAGQRLQYYHMDPVLNMLRSHDFRRKRGDSNSESGSSSREFKDWKEEFKQLWLHKKYEALNQTRPKGDAVNMAAARPWGVQCGDPGQHDMPWGSCMLAMECEPEFRIYRGDVYCGRTQFVCCAIQITSYDLYQGFDVSFDDKSLSTDTEEKKGKGSSDDKKKREEKARKKRREIREKRKKKIKDTIKKTVKEIRKLLNRQFKNGTREIKKRTNQLKKFIKKLKEQFKKDSKAIRDLHEKDSIKLDNGIMKKLQQIKDVNQNFMKNATFRDIVVNGTITKQGARMLLQAYPEMEAFLEARKNAAAMHVRRSQGGAADGDPLEYDIEYGYLYY